MGKVLHKSEGESMQPSVLKENKSELEYLKIDNQSKTAIILFHGYGASMNDLYGIGQYVKLETTADWFFPNGHLSLEMMGMMSARAWFPIDAKALEQAMMSGTFRDFQTLTSPEFEVAVEKCKSFIGSLAEKYDKVIVGGFSQGAMVSTHASLDISDKVDALLCLSGTLISKDKLISRLDSAKKFPFFQTHGKQDQVLSYDAGKNLFELLKLGGHQGEFVSFEGGHEIPADALSKMEHFINKI
jgi:phospholipase/carboxylesterase